MSFKPDAIPNEVVETEEPEKEKVESAKTFLVDWVKKVEEAEKEKKAEAEQKLVDDPELPVNFETATQKKLAEEVEKTIKLKVGARGIKHFKASEFLKEERAEEKMAKRIDEAIERRTEENLENIWGEYGGKKGKYKTFGELEGRVDKKIEELQKKGIEIDKPTFCDLMNQGYEMDDIKIAKNKAGDVKGISVHREGVTVIMKLEEAGMFLAQAKKDMETTGKNDAEAELEEMVRKGKKKWERGKQVVTKQVIKAEVEKINKKRAGIAPESYILESKLEEYELKSNDEEGGIIEGLTPITDKEKEELEAILTEREQAGNLIEQPKSVEEVSEDKSFEDLMKERDRLTREFAEAGHVDAESIEKFKSQTETLKKKLEIVKEREGRERQTKLQQDIAGIKVNLAEDIGKIEQEEQENIRKVDQQLEKKMRDIKRRKDEEIAALEKRHRERKFWEIWK